MQVGRTVVVEQHVAVRRMPQADDVVDEEAMPGRAVDAGEAEGKDEGAEDEVHHRPHEGADEVPEGDIELRLEAPGDGDEKLRRHHADDDEDHEVDGEGELAGLEALVPARSDEHTSEL